MSRRHTRLLIAVPVLLALAAGWTAVDTVRHMTLTAGCQSDNLSMVARSLREYAEAHDGRLPPLGEVRAVTGDGIPDRRLTCNQARLPYQWNLQLAEMRLDSPGKQAAAWCPPSSHGRYVGVITVGRGEVRAEVLTLDELRGLLPGGG